ncbi:MAG: ATP-binding protein [Hyphomicrobiaceae bacterium]
MNGPDSIDVETLVRCFLETHGIEASSISLRTYPEETIIVLEVPEAYAQQAVSLSSSLEDQLPPAHLVVIRSATVNTVQDSSSVKTVADPKVSRLIELLNERSRTSEQQPSLQYIRDAAENLRIAVTKRHHIVFGRRGVGKTALLLEAKRQIEENDGICMWVNVQILRGLGAPAAFLTIVKRICELPAIVHYRKPNLPQSRAVASKIMKWAQQLLQQVSVSADQAGALVPEVQRLATLLTAELQSDLYIFLDDFHYLGIEDQPKFLDLLHGMTRDTASWIKLAGIRNQCRVFQSDPPIGMQIGHDAAVIPLDITLEDPQKARQFLSDVLETYLTAAGIPNRSGVLSGGALDRLVLASAGVPRDFLILTGRSIQIARQRENARIVGTQDVNEAAGEAGAQKLSELEDDAASATGRAQIRLKAMDLVRSFAIQEHHHSFFRINFRDKAERAEEYALLQSLMDLRMIHLVKGSLSEAHEAGEKSEVYMIDLSEYSGSRLKKDISVIELQGDTLVLRKTGEQGSKVVADTPRKLVQIFRTGPELQLQTFSNLL